MSCNENMSGKCVTVSLKVPSRPPTLLHILENSLLEGIVDYKPLAAEVDPRAVRSREIPTAYQLKADVCVIEDELQVRFVAKNVGLHVARIFANTKEVCHAITFNVTLSGEVEGLDAPPKKQGLDQVEARQSKYGSSYYSAATTAANSATSTVRAVESEHRLSHGNPPVSPNRVTFSNNVFEQLLHKKGSTGPIPGIIPSSSRPGSTALTAEMFKSFGSSAKLKIPGKFGRNIKARCSICLRKTKLSKSVSLMEMTFCDPCFTNLFLLKSGIDHFMPPIVKESAIQIPVNKRRTKFATVTRELPDVNLKGLTATDVRIAQVEFNKFDIEGDGWLNKVILLPLIKACFTPSIPEPTIRRLISGQPLQSMIANMELDSRDRIHEIEFLSLMAFIARESLRVHQDMSMSSRFTHQDLAMAYAYQHQKAMSQTRAPSVYQFPKPRQPDLIEGVRKSLTDSPLSYFHPVSTKDLSPSAFVSNDQNMISSLQKDNENEKELEETDGGEPMINVEESELEATENVLPLSEPQSKRNSTLGTKQKGQKKEEMENLKLTGDKKADGWMMY